MSQTLNPLEQYVRDVVDIVVRYYESGGWKITAAEIMGPSRQSHIIEPRHLVMWVCAPNLSSTTIGRYMDRDHTSVLNGVSKIEVTANGCSAFSLWIAEIKAECEKVKPQVTANRMISARSRKSKRTAAVRNVHRRLLPGILSVPLQQLLSLLAEAISEMLASELDEHVQLQRLNRMIEACTSEVTQ
jgi:hypothetical protein